MRPFSRSILFASICTLLGIAASTTAGAAGIH